MLGWEPRVTHEHYAPDGVLTGYTVVTTEAEFDDFERDHHLAFAEYQRGVGPCGFHHSLTTDPANGFTFDTRHCPVCAGKAVQDRVQTSADEAALADLKSRHGGKVPPDVKHPGDGDQTFMRPMTEAEVTARKAKSAKPARA